MNKVERERIFDNGKKLQIVQGDLTEEDTDAIVNAANSHLSHGGGVAGAIVRKGGYVIQEESNKKSPIPTGKATFTSGGNLKSKYVIHAVGPVYGEGDEDRKLLSAINSSLKVAEDLNISSVSFPAVSSGIFGFPKERCAEIFINALDEYLLNKETCINLIRLCNIDAKTVEIFKKIFDLKYGI
ncbi:MAG: macro domain-containing protein [bacterium]|nr:macro domain-containing protein [bacterium]